MAWLRIDDKFDRHPKVTQLNHKERWVWIGLLCYCASYQTGGYLPNNIDELVVGANTRYLAKCSSLELIDVVAGELRIHDWDTYAPKDPSGSDRQAAWRRRQRNGGVTDEVTDDGVTDPSLACDARAGTRARSRPVLSPLSNSEAVVVDAAREAADGTAQGVTHIRNTIDSSLKEAS